MHLNTYFAIQKVRFDGDFQFKFDIEDGLETVHIPKFSLQPLVENAIFHGFNQTRKKGCIKITAYKRDSRLIIKVLDNGVGMEAPRLKEVTNALRSGAPRRRTGSDPNGVALLNVHKRIQLYYGEDCGMAIRSWKNIGTVVILTLPY